jgi:hypothetical protein
MIRPALGYAFGEIRVDERDVAPVAPGFSAGAYFRGAFFHVGKRTIACETSQGIARADYCRTILANSWRDRPSGN